MPSVVKVLRHLEVHLRVDVHRFELVEREERRARAEQVCALARVVDTQQSHLARDVERVKVLRAEDALGVKIDGRAPLVDEMPDVRRDGDERVVLRGERAERSRMKAAEASSMK